MVSSAMADGTAALGVLRRISEALERDGALPVRLRAAGAAVTEGLADACVIEQPDGADPRLAAGSPTAVDSPGAHHLACAMVHRDRPVGTLQLWRTAERAPWSELERLTAQEAAARLAAAIVTHARELRTAEAASAQDHFLATISHEMRTPLGVMVGWIEMLRTGRLDAERQTRAVEVLGRNARALTRLIEDLLETSRILADRLGLELTNVPVADLVLGVVESVRPTAQAAGLELDAQADASIYIRADRERIDQVLHNLVGNALKFTPAGGSVNVTLVVRDGSAVITVADTGVGLAPELLPRIFDRFWQEERRGKVTGRGLGLGLFIVRHLVQLHGGTISAESDGPGRGARFTVSLPIEGPPSGPGPSIPS